MVVPREIYRKFFLLIPPRNHHWWSLFQNFYSSSYWLQCTKWDYSLEAKPSETDFAAGTSIFLRTETEVLFSRILWYMYAYFRSFRSKWNWPANNKKTNIWIPGFVCYEIRFSHAVKYTEEYRYAFDVLVWRNRYCEFY